MYQLFLINPAADEYYGLSYTVLAPMPALVSTYKPLNPVVVPAVPLVPIIIAPAAAAAAGETPDYGIRSNFHGQ